MRLAQACLRQDEAGARLQARSHRKSRRPEGNAGSRRGKAGWDFLCRTGGSAPAQQGTPARTDEHAELQIVVTSVCRKVRTYSNTRLT